MSVRAPIELGPQSFGWYHVEFRPDGFLVDEQEARESLDKLLAFLDEIPGPVYLMGFSQGCIMALGVALREPEKAAAVVGMSGRLLDGLVDASVEPERLRGLPVMVVHGTSDNVIPIRDGRGIRDRLSALPVDLTYREYDMGHYVTQESMHDIRQWLAERLASPGWRSRSA
jgi:phospholipase/carboxylesterase